MCEYEENIEAGKAVAFKPQDILVSTETSNAWVRTNGGEWFIVTVTPSRDSKLRDEDMAYSLKAWPMHYHLVRQGQIVQIDSK